MKSIRSHPTRSLLLLLLLLSALSFAMEYAAHGRLSALYRFSSGHRAAFAGLCCLFVGLLRWVLSGVFSWWTLADALAGAALVSLLLWFQCSGESC